ncbi:MAG: hypothetical protein WCN98_06075 [Verrucomicrobiaceae bacterium]
MSRRPTKIFLAFLVLILLGLTAWIYWALNRIEEVRKSGSYSIRLHPEDIAKQS